MSWNVLHIKVNKMIMKFMFNHQLQVVKFWKVSQKLSSSFHTVRKFFHLIGAKDPKKCLCFGQK